MPEPTNNDNPLVSNNYFGLGFNADERTTCGRAASTTACAIETRCSADSRSTKNIQTYSNGVPATDMSSGVNTVYNLYKDVNFAGNWTHSFSPTFLSEIAGNLFT